MEVLVFYLDDDRYALPLSTVQRVVRAVEVTPLPKAPDVVSGIINVAGEVTPVFNIRKRFGKTCRDLDPADTLVLARTSKRTVGVSVDRVQFVIRIDRESWTEPEQILSGIGYLAGVARLPDGMVLIHDLETFLSPSEDRQLDEALRDEKLN